MKKNEQLQSARLTLKAFEECDKPQMLDIFFNEDIKKTYMIPDFEDHKQAEKLFDKFMAYSRSDDHFEYGIYFNNRLIGFVNDCEIKNQTIELGYVIHPKYQGNGFATEALQICIAELFRMGFTHITAGFFQGNLASCRVMEKCGMQKLDFEEDIEYKGRMHHCLYYGIERTAASV